MANATGSEMASRILLIGESAFNFRLPSNLGGWFGSINMQEYSDRKTDETPGDTAEADLSLGFGALFPRYLYTAH